MKRFCCVFAHHLGKLVSNPWGMIWYTILAFVGFYHCNFIYIKTKLTFSMTSLVLRSWRISFQLTFHWGSIICGCVAGRAEDSMPICDIAYCNLKYCIFAILI